MTAFDMQEMFINKLESEQVAPIDALRELIKAYVLSPNTCYYEKQIYDIVYNVVNTQTPLAACVYGCKTPFVSEGLINILTEDELYSVLMHEMAHIELNLFVCIRRDKESLLSYFIRDQYFERAVDQLAIKRGAVKKDIRTAVIKLLKSEQKRLLTNRFQKTNIVDAVLTGLVFKGIILSVRFSRFI